MPGITFRTTKPVFAKKELLVTSFTIYTKSNLSTSSTVVTGKYLCPTEALF